MEGKTKAMIMSNVQQSELKKWDQGYIDGYVRGADDRAYAVFVRLDGLIDLVSLYQLRADAKQGYL